MQTCIIQLCVKKISIQDQGTSTGHSDDYPSAWADDSGCLLGVSPTAAAAAFVHSEFAMPGMSSSLVEGSKTQWIDGVTSSLSQFACPIEVYR
jgi:hypothetical protein